MLFGITSECLPQMRRDVCFNVNQNIGTLSALVPLPSSLQREMLSLSPQLNNIKTSTTDVVPLFRCKLP